jgi:hypothetical protein
MRMQGSDTIFGNDKFHMGGAGYPPPRKDYEQKHDANIDIGRTRRVLEKTDRNVCPTAGVMRV